MSVASSPAPASSRTGLIAGGNFIVDTIVRIDHFPAEDMLANILDEAPCNGGGPYNVLKDLAALDAPFPLHAIGLVGEDANGQWIRQDCQTHGIDIRQLHTAPGTATSHTHVMTVPSTGRRTFFHHRGANRDLAPVHFDFRATTARIFHLGYLMLLDTLDASDDTGRSGASRVLEAATAAGLITTVDLVSVEHPHYRPIVESSLPWIDHLIINEVEAGRLVNRPLSASDVAGLAAAASQILAQGVRAAVVIHTSETAVIASRTEGNHQLDALVVPPTEFKGANGAGDAFAAGYLYGLHEGKSAPERLEIATCVAACSVTHPSPSDGVKPLADCLKLSGSLNRRVSPASAISAAP